MGAHIEFRIVCGRNGAHRVVLANLAPTAPYNKNGVWVGDRSELLALDWACWDKIATYNKTGRTVRDNGVSATRAGNQWRFWCKSCRKSWLVDDAEIGQRILDRVRHGVSEADIAELVR